MSKHLRQQATGNRQQATGNRQRDNTHHLLTIGCYFLAVAISLMAMVKPVQASGTVAPLPDMQYSVSLWTTWTWVSLGVYKYTSTPISCSAPSIAGLVPCVSAVAGGTVGYYSYDGNLVGGSPGGFTDAIAYHVGCPANSKLTGANTCTCNDPYVPDATATSCVLNQYTLTLTPDTATIEPGNTYTLTATVTNQDGSPPAQDVPVSVKVEVNPTSGGHDHGEAYALRPKGSVSPASGNNSFTITFSSTEISGTHTITVKCDLCSNSPKTATVDVKVDGLWPIPDSAYYALTEDGSSQVIGSTTDHMSNHYLTSAASMKLWRLAADFYDYQIQNGVAKPTLLHLNDASLKWGGIFDLDAEHKRGTVIDVRANSNPGAIPSSDFTIFIALAAKYKIDAGIHNPGETIQHFHLRLLNRSE